MLSLTVLIVISRYTEVCGGRNVAILNIGDCFNTPLTLEVRPMVGTYLDWRGYLPVNTCFSLILQILSWGYVVEDMDISKTFDFYKVHLRQDLPYLSRGISGVAADICMHTASSEVAYLRHAGCAPRAGLRKSVVALRRSFHNRSLAFFCGSLCKQ